MPEPIDSPRLSIVVRRVEELEAELGSRTEQAPVGTLVRYANALLARYEAVGDLRDVDTALDIARQADAAAGDERVARSVALNVLANAHMAAYRERGQRADLAAALAAQRETVRLSGPGDEGRVPFVVNLANRLLSIFDVTRDAAILDEAIDATTQVLDSAMPDPWRAAALNNLGLALRARFAVSGRRKDLDASLRAQQESLRLTGTDAVERVNRLNNLANAQWALYLSTGVLADLDDAVDAYTAAVKYPANPNTRAACLLGLGTARWSRWGRRKLPGDLDAAIEAFTSAAELVDSATPTAVHCDLNLGAAYFARWRHFRQRADLDRAIASWAAARTSPAATREIAEAAASNLGGALWERYEDASEETDLHEAIDLLGAAAQQELVTSQPSRIFTLAGALRRRFELFGDADDRHRAIAAFRAACVLGLTLNPGVALSSGQSWGEWASRRRSFVEADEAFTRATAAAMNLYRSQRTEEHTEVWLRQAPTLAARHAYAQVRLDQRDRAVVTLERGRAYVLSEALRSAPAADA
jgi:tetratricopeptide (TPR) repeat protein